MKQHLLKILTTLPFKLIVKIKICPPITDKTDPMEKEEVYEIRYQCGKIGTN
jgi:hypothetical protein